MAANQVDDPIKVLTDVFETLGLLVNRTVHAQLTQKRQAVGGCRGVDLGALDLGKLNGEVPHAAGAPRGSGPFAPARCDHAPSTPARRYGPPAAHRRRPANQPRPECAPDARQARGRIRQSACAFCSAQALGVGGYLQPIRPGNWPCFAFSAACTGCGKWLQKVSPERSSIWFTVTW